MMMRQMCSLKPCTDDVSEELSDMSHKGILEKRSNACDKNLLKIEVFARKTTSLINQ